MQSMRSKIHRALAFVHAAIETPVDEHLCDANRHAAEVLAELDWSCIEPALRQEVGQLTAALRVLRQVLSSGPSPGVHPALETAWPPPSRAGRRPVRSLF